MVTIEKQQEVLICLLKDFLTNTFKIKNKEQGASTKKLKTKYKKLKLLLGLEWEILQKYHG